MNIRRASGILALALPAMAQAQTVVNFQDAFADSFGDPPLVFVGQGAYADGTNNTWNPFAASGVQSTFGAAASDGSLTLVTTTAVFAFSNGGAAAINQGLPDFVLGNALVVNGATPLGTFSIQNVPPGSYDLYLYGTNYDTNRGTIFTASSGTADSGMDATLNSYRFAYTEGLNYVLFHGVTPDANGTITGTWAPNPADGVGNSNFAGEGDFNGFQLVGTPTAGTIGACCIGAGCAQGTGAACTSAAGTFHGISSTCEAANCPTPGACCMGCAGCIVLPPASCAGAGNTFYGFGTTCAAATNCSLVNGGFESGDFTGWTQFGDMSFTSVSSGDGDIAPHTGTYFGDFGCDPSVGGGVQQVIPAHVGDQVTIGFAYWPAMGPPNLVEAQFDGQTLLDLVNVDDTNGWVVVSYTLTVANDNPMLMFTFGSSPWYIGLDDVTVCISPVGTGGGVCCRGATCNTTVGQAACVHGAGTAGASFVSTSSACNATTTANTPCCTADYNKTGGITVQDIFDFLADWFAGSPFAATGGSGGATALSVQNIFDFLSAWFSGGC